MFRWLPILLLPTASLLAGCLGADDAVEPQGLPDVVGLLRPAAEPLWFSPQYFPHPMFNYPTLTNPASGAAVSKWLQPIAPRALPAAIAGLEYVSGTGDAVPTGSGMSVFGSIAVVPGRGEGTFLVDISNPQAPAVVGHFDENTRGSDIIAYPDGRLVTVLATGSGVLLVYDITDPTMPVKLAEMEPTTGTHKVNVVPGTPIVYNANSNGGSNVDATAMGVTEIFDLTDPANPVHVQDFPNGYGCHHIYFYIRPDENHYRAICAGIEVTQLWDIADPRNPEVVVNIPVHEGNPALPSSSIPLMRFSHFAILNDDHTVLIVGDEAGGGGLPPGCDAHAEAGPLSVSGPLGNIYFYDVSDEQNPQLQGWLSPTFPAASNPPDPASGPGAAFYSCTAHHGRLVPDPERDILAMAFYRAGVVLVDFTDPSSPRILDQWNDGTNTWEVAYYNGYLFTGDIARGLDVLTLR